MHILDGLGLELDKAGYIKLKDGGYVPTYCGEECERIDKVGGFAHVETAEGDVKLVHDNFSCIVNWQSKRDLGR